MTLDLEAGHRVMQRYAEYFQPQVINLERFKKENCTETLVLIKTELFAKLAFPLKYSAKHYRKEDRTNEAAKSGGWDDLPYLVLRIKRDSPECLVTGHEGRHRTIFMGAHDIPYTPVVFRAGRNEEDTTSDKLYWDKDSWRPSLIRSQNEKLVFPMPQSIIHPASLIKH